MNIFSGNDEHNHKYHLEVKDIYNDFLLLLFFAFSEQEQDRKQGRRKKERNSRNGRVTVIRQVSENITCLTRLFASCGVVMGYHCRRNHNRSWCLVFYLTGGIFQMCSRHPISRK